MHLLGQFQPISNRACSFHQAKSGPANLHKDPELSHIESDWKPDASARADSVAASPSQIGNPTRQRGRIQLPLLARRTAQCQSSYPAALSLNFPRHQARLD